jgi:hypothetical protein
MTQDDLTMDKLRCPTTRQSQVAMEAKAKALASVATELEDLRRQTSEKGQKLAESQWVELELRGHARALEERERTVELEIATRVDQESQKIREETARMLTEEHRLRDAEKDKKLQDANQGKRSTEPKTARFPTDPGGSARATARGLIKSAFPWDGVESRQ